jgi:hypothetical protein
MKMLTLYKRKAYEGALNQDQSEATHHAYTRGFLHAGSVPIPVPVPMFVSMPIGSHIFKRDLQTLCKRVG